MVPKKKHLMLEVDLASKQWRVRSLDEKIIKDYIGGLGIGMKILYASNIAIIIITKFNN